MATAYDVPGTELIEEMAKELMQNKNIIKPEYTEYVKTGSHRERSPQREDWYYIRMASVLRRIYIDGPTGTGSLRTYYGGRKNRGVKPHKHVKAAGKIIRNCLQSLEKEGLIKKEKKGRTITKKGLSFISKTAKKVGEHLKANPKTQKKKNLVLAKEKAGGSQQEAKPKKGKEKDESRGNKGKKDK